MRGTAQPGGSGVAGRTGGPGRSVPAAPAFGRAAALAACLLGGAVLAAWAPVLVELADVWSRRPEASHGFLILPAALYFAWMKRDTLARIAPRPNLGLGLPILVASILALRLGHAAEVVTVSSLGLVGMAFALVLLLLGTAHLRVLLFPLVFLVFMTPVLDTLVEPLHHPFQLATVKVAAAALTAIGIPTYVQQEQIILAPITLEVARACSGVGIFVSVLAVGLAAAYLMLRRWTSWAVLVASALLIGTVANWLRVTVIGVWAQLGGTVVHGPLHVFQAMSAAVVAYVGMAVVAWLLVRRERRLYPEGPVGPDASPPGGPGVGSRVPSHTLTTAWAAGLALVLLLDGHLYLMGLRPVPIREPLVTLPAALGPWRGAPADLGAAPFRIAGASDELFRHYAVDGTCATDLYVGYLPVQRQGHELVNHLSRQLHEGATLATFDLGPGGSLTANAGQVHARDGRVAPILFWYEINGWDVADRIDAERGNLLGALVHRHNNGALVVLSTRGGEPEAWHVCLRAHGFLERLVPALRLHL